MFIIWAILLFISGGCVGASIVLAYLNKSRNRLMEAYDCIVRSYDNICFINDSLIENYRKIIENTYTLLVRHRDTGEGNLDKIIGALGEALDDHKEDSDESDSD